MSQMWRYWSNRRGKTGDTSPQGNVTVKQFPRQEVRCSKYVWNIEDAHENTYTQYRFSKISKYLELPFSTDSELFPKFQ